MNKGNCRDIEMCRSKIIFDAVHDYFARNRLTVVDIAILQAADPFLDMAGEDLRRRIFMTESENGDSLCLRPEFTIPVCLEHMASRRMTPHIYAYSGEVFRQKGRTASKFHQAGIEEFGAPDEAVADARSLYHATAMLRHIAPRKKTSLLVGDYAVFAAVLAALGLPPGWQKKLLRCFGNDRQLHQLLADFAKPEPPPSLPPAIRQLTGRGDKKALIQQIGQDMLAADISPSAGRTPGEIAERLLEKHALANRRLEKPAAAALEDFLAIDVPLEQAAQALSQFCAGHGLALGDVVSRFAARAGAIERQGLDLTAIRYNAAFGRALDYYTGFVYEIHDHDKESRLLAGGGRYDRLLTMLGARVPIAAVGFSIWLNRL